MTVASPGPSALLLTALLATGCAPALSTMATARTLRPDEGQVWLAVESQGFKREAGAGGAPRLEPLQQFQVGVREGVTDSWETGVRFSPAGVELEQKLQLVRSPLEVAGIDVALSAGAGAAIWQLDEWNTAFAGRLRAELPVAFRLPDTSQIILSPRALFTRCVPAPDSDVRASNTLLVGGSAAFAWRVGSGYLVPELSVLLTVMGPPEGDLLRGDPIVIRAGLGFLLGG